MTFYPSCKYSRAKIESILTIPIQSSGYLESEQYNPIQTNYVIGYMNEWMNEWMDGWMNDITQIDPNWVIPNQRAEIVQTIKTDPGALWTLVITI